MNIDVHKEICFVVKMLVDNSPELLEMICLLPYVDAINFNIDNWLAEVKNADVGNYLNNTINIYPVDQSTDKYPSYISCQKYKYPPTVGWNIIVGTKGNRNGFAQLTYCYDTNFMAELISTCKSKDFKNLLNFI